MMMNDFTTSRWKRPYLFFLLILLLLFGGGLLYYYFYKPVKLQSGACTSKDSPVHQTLVRKTDNTYWCLSGLHRKAIRWQWSPDHHLFAYALQDQTQPVRRLSGRHGYIEVDNLNWYIMNANSTRHRRFSEPDPFYFSFSADVQYAVYTTYNDYGNTKREIVKVSNGSLVCRYGTYALWYTEGVPPCDNVRFRNRSLWDIQAEYDRRACEYYRLDSGWRDPATNQYCRELLKGSPLVPTVTPIPSPYPAVSPTPNLPVYP